MPSTKPDLSSFFQRTIQLLVCILLVPALAGCGALNSLLPPTATPTATVTPTSTLTPTPTQTSTPTLTPSPTPIPVLCGGPPAMFILLVGSDARRDTYDIGLADSMRVVRVDFFDPRLQVLSFPRDLYVEIPEIEDHYGITHGKLNQAFLYGNPGYNYYDGPGRGAGLLAMTLEKNFDSQVDHYVAVNFQTFVRIVDELGGIDINLPYTIDGRVKRSTDPNRFFPAGEQHLNGYRTMLLARMRPGGDFDRIEIQNLILEALAEKLLSPSAILKLPGLIQTFTESVQTDLGPVEIAQLLCLRSSLIPQNIYFGSFPSNLFENDRVDDPVLGNTSILKVDFEILKTYVQSFNHGSWPAAPNDSSAGITP